MGRFGLLDGSFNARSGVADAQRTVNLFSETNESGDAASALTLYYTPGRKKLLQIAGPVRALAEINGRVFAVGGASLYELFANGTSQVRGGVANDGKPASIAIGNTQILVAAGGSVYVFNLNTGAFQQIPPAMFNGPISQVDWCDDFFLALMANSAQVYCSTPGDATSWPGDQTTLIEVYPDQVVGMKVNSREPVMFGRRKTVVYYDAGANVFPFLVVPGGFSEHGLAAGFSLAKLDNSFFWLGEDQGGGRMVWRNNGYTPQRVSNHAVETAIDSYVTVSDAIGWAYVDGGHSFYVLTFPTANHTWCFDVAESRWHERGMLNVDGSIGADLAQCYCFGFGQHLVGYADGRVLIQSMAYLDDDGTPIRRLRRSSPIIEEHNWLFHSELEVLMETGQGTVPPLLDAQGNPRGPWLNLRWSDDGGKTWSNIHTVDTGQAGKFNTRAVWRRLGRSRERVYEISVSDPIAWAFVDGYVQAAPAYQKPAPRFAKRWQQVG